MSSSASSDNQHPVSCPTSDSSYDRLSIKMRQFKETGDSVHFAEILDDTRAEMEAFAQELCKGYPFSADDAAKLLNDAAMKLLRAAPRFDIGRPLIPFYKKIVVRCAIDHARYERRRRVESLSQNSCNEESGPLAYAFEPAAPAIADPAIEAASNEGVARIQQAIDRLPEAEGRFMRAKIAGSRRCEIALQFGCSADKVSRILHRARKRLRVDLK